MNKARRNLARKRRAQRKKVAAVVATMVPPSPRLVSSRAHRKVKRLLSKLKKYIEDQRFSTSIVVQPYTLETAQGDALDAYAEGELGLIRMIGESDECLRARAKAVFEGYR